MKKRNLLTLLVVCMMLALLPGTVLAEDNSCGPNATWMISGNTLTISGTGRMYDYQYDKTSPWYKQKKDINKVVIGDGITYIGNEAFIDCEQLSSVTISNTVTSIGDSAFIRCKQLSNVTIPNGVTSIGGGAFLGCERLSKVTIPSTVTLIENGAFATCQNLKTVNYGGTEEQWNKIWISTDSFSCLFSATGKINYAGSSGTQTVMSGNCSIDKDSALGNYNVIWTMDRDGVLNFSGVGDIPNYYWHTVSPWSERRDNTVKITFDRDINRIGNENFQYFSSLYSVTIPGYISSIGNRAFYQCANLSEVTILDGTTILEYQAFQGCESLTSVILPASIDLIEYDAFDGCNRLTDIYYAGTETQWDDIQIGNNSIPDICKIHYNSGLPTPVTYTIIFDANGGTLPAVSETMTVEEGGVLGTLPTPTRDGFTFNGWYTAADGGEKVDESAVCTADITLYAHWDRDTVGPGVKGDLNGDGKVNIADVVKLARYVAGYISTLD